MTELNLQSTLIFTVKSREMCGQYTDCYTQSTRDHELESESKK